MRSEEQLTAYRKRLIDRFGPLPHCAEELIKVVSLRRLGKELGCEKILLKQGRMSLYFVSQHDSPYYQSAAFDRILTFVAQNPRRCNFREQTVTQHSGQAPQVVKRSMLITDVPTVTAAVQLLSSLSTMKPQFSSDET